MPTMRGDGASIGAGIGPNGSGTIHANGGPDMPSGFAPGPSSTSRSSGADIASGFGPMLGALAASVKRGDSMTVNGIAYTFERVISKSTGEAEIFLLARGGTPYVFKLYYPNFKPKEQILAPLKQLRHEDIINIIDYGYFHERFFEIMEYAEGGTLEQHLPIRDLKRLRVIVSETVNAFKFCHAHGIVHKDIKPGNLYYKNADGSNLAIGDFGISSSLEAGLSRHLTSQALTVGYAAPEMYGIGGKVYVGREVDYYALGITLIHLWQAKNPFEGLTIHAIANLTNSGAIKVPDDLPKELQTLIRGLITIDFTKRWGYNEVQRWLNGEDVPVHFSVKEVAYPPFQFGLGEEAASPEALASLLKSNPGKGKKHLYSGKISAWVNLFDHKVAAELDKIVEEAYPKDQDAGLQKAIYILGPDEPYAQDGREARSTEELATALEDGFSVYLSALANPNHPFYLYLEAHEAQREADSFRAYFKTFNAKRALNTIILELSGRQSITLFGEVFTTAEAVLRARDKASAVNMLKDRDSRLSLWIEGTANQTIKSQLEAWRALKICDATTFAYVSASGDGIPRIELSKDSFSFSDLKSRAVISDSFEIRNTGGGALTGPIVANKNWLRLGQRKIDPNRKTQTISFSVDTAGLTYGTTDSGVIEVQSNVGVETVNVSIAIELGVKAAARFRTLMTIGAGALGALVGFATPLASQMASAGSSSGLIGLAAVLAMTMVAAMVGRRPVRSGLLALVCGLVLFSILNFIFPVAYFGFPVAYSVLGWAVFLMGIAYAASPRILAAAQAARNRKLVPIGVTVGTVALSTTMAVGDIQLGNWMAQDHRQSIDREAQFVEPASGPWKPVYENAEALARAKAQAVEYVRTQEVRAGRAFTTEEKNVLEKIVLMLSGAKKGEIAFDQLSASRDQFIRLMQQQSGEPLRAETIGHFLWSHSLDGYITPTKPYAPRGASSSPKSPKSVAQPSAEATPVTPPTAQVPAAPPTPMARDAKSGCHLWKPNLQPNDTVRWTGGCTKSLAEGQGKAEWFENGAPKLTYEGTFKAGMLQGFGRMTAAGGDRYEGEYRDGKRDGRGTYVFASGERYEGTWKDNKREGQGVIVGADGSRYEGFFRDGKPVATARPAPSPNVGAPTPEARSSPPAIMQPSPQRAEPSQVEARFARIVSTSVAEGNSCLQAKNYECAIAKAESALQIEPAHSAALALKKLAIAAQQEAWERSELK